MPIDRIELVILNLNTTASVIFFDITSKYGVEIFLKSIFKYLLKWRRYSLKYNTFLKYYTLCLKCSTQDEEVNASVSMQHFVN